MRARINGNGAPPAIVVVGDALLDRDVAGRVERISPDAPVPVIEERTVSVRPGGAGLAATLAASDGLPVTLITAFGNDVAGRELAAALAERGVAVVDLGTDGATAEKIRVRGGDHTLFRLDRGGEPGPIGPPTSEALAALERASAILVSDYGRGVAGGGELRRALAATAGSTPIVWDPHRRGPAPVPGTRIATPNLSEVERIAGPATRLAELTAAGERLARRWRVDRVCITRGEQGAILCAPGEVATAVPGEPAPGRDPCGAGDRFASAATAALATGATPAEAVRRAVARASAYVAAGGASALAGEPPAPAERGVPTTRSETVALAERVRARGGTVVATGGCFDLLHPGHIRTLESARLLGDCLIVCLNSDRSVRRLKGPDRPLVGEEERAAVLAALRCVDAVVRFDEETPTEVLETIRPHVWAKGGDYAGAELPEAATLASWGGQAVLLPYVDGHSTTRLIEGASRVS